MKMKLTKQMSYIVRYLGWGIASLFGLFVGSAMLKMQGEYGCDDIDRAAKREAKILKWTTEISPDVKKAKDEYGFDHLCRRRPDSSAQSDAEALFVRMAHAAVEFRNDAVGMGMSMNEIRVTVGHCTLNRVTTVASSFHVQTKPNGSTEVVHPADERNRLKDLDRAMKRFLN